MKVDNDNVLANSAKGVRFLPNIFCHFVVRPGNGGRYLASVKLDGALHEICFKGVRNYAHALTFAASAFH